MNLACEKKSVFPVRLLPAADHMKYILRLPSGGC